MKLREKKLIKLIKDKGDRKAANELITLYYKDIYTYVLRQTRDEELSKDLTQETFIAMLKAISSFQGNSSFKTWLYKVSSNKIIDYYRSKYHKYTTLVQEIENQDFSSTFNLEEDFQIREEVSEVMEIVNTMNSNIQQIFRMKAFSDMTFKEIAKVLDISEATVKTRYYSSIRKIKSLMEVKNDER